MLDELLVELPVVAAATAATVAAGGVFVSVGVFVSAETVELGIMGKKLI